MQAGNPSNTTGDVITRVLAAVSCLLLPGLGLAIAGPWWRGAVASGAMIALISCGLILGGTGIIDRKSDSWWFALQAPAGVPVWTIDTLNQRVFKGIDRGLYRLPTAREQIDHAPDPASLTATRRVVVDVPPDQQPPLWPRASFGRPKEIGSMSVACGGLLNLIAMLVCIAAPRTPEDAA